MPSFPFHIYYGQSNSTELEYNIRKHTLRLLLLFRWNWIDTKWKLQKDSIIYILERRRWAKANHVFVIRWGEKRERRTEKCTSIFKIKFYAIEQFAKLIFMSQLSCDSFICVWRQEFPFNLVQLVLAVISTFHWIQFACKQMYSHHFLCADFFNRKCTSTSWRFQRMSIDNGEEEKIACQRKNIIVLCVYV